MNSVLQSTSTISRPTVPTEKAVQTGRHLTTTRANPNFCVSCGVRHSNLACPLMDPVSAIIPTLMTFNPENRDVPKLKPSRCKDCIKEKRTTEIIGGKKIVTTTTALCPVHLLQYETDPVTLDTAPTLTNMDSTDAPHSSSFDELILADIENDPFSFLVPAAPADEPAAPADEPAAPADEPAAPSDEPAAPADEPAVPADEPAAIPPNPSSDDGSAHGKTRTRRYTFRDLKTIQKQYEIVMEDCSTGTSIDNACKKLGVSRTAFYTRKYLTEMMVIDLQAFDVMKNEVLSEKKTLGALNKLCKEKIATSPYKHVAKRLRCSGQLLRR